MPRQSADARAAAAFRAGSSHPKPPRGLTGRAKGLWLEIVRSKPIDWFDPGSFPLLRQYCVLAAYAEEVGTRLRVVPRGGPAVAGGEPVEPVDPAALAAARSAAVKELREVAATCTSLATKLRLSVQSNVERHSRMLDEPGLPPAPVATRPHLIGGKAVA